MKSHARYVFCAVMLIMSVGMSLTAKAAGRDDDDRDRDRNISAPQAQARNEGQNLLPNGGFETGAVAPWIFQNWPRRGSAKVVKYKRGGTQGNSRYLQVDVKKDGAYWMTHVRQSVAFAPQEYTLSFWARAEKGRKMIVNAQEEGTWENLRLWQEPRITQEWKFYSYTFTPQTSTAKGQIVFNLGDQEGAVWLDEVWLTSEGVPTPPQAPGAFQVRMSNTPESHVVIAGSSDVTFANFLLDTTGSGEDVLMNSFQVTEITNSAVYPARINNLRLFVMGNVLLATSNDPDPLQVTPGTEEVLTFDLVNPLYLSKESVTTIALKGDIAEGATSGVVQFGLKDTGTHPAPTVTGVVSGDQIIPEVVRTDGPFMTLGAAGSLALEVDSSNPAAGLLVGNANGVTVGVLRARAVWEDIRLQQLSFTVNPVNGGGPDQFTKVWLTDGEKTFGVVPTSTDAMAPVPMLFDLSADPILIPQNSQKLLTLKVDTENIDASNNARGGTGQGFQLGINAVADVAAWGTTSWKRAGVVGTPQLNAYTLYRSVPTIDTTQVVTNAVTGNGMYELFKVRVSADQKGPVGIYKMRFGITSFGVTLTDLALYDSSALSAPVAQRTTTLVPQGEYQLDFLFDTDGSGTDNGGEFREIPAGTSRTFTLKAAVSGYQSGQSNGVSTRLFGDSAFPSPVVACAGAALGNNACNGIDAPGTNHFIWTDFSYTTMYNTSTATNTAEWTNGYRVPGLPPSSTVAQGI